MSEVHSVSVARASMDREEGLASLLGQANFRRKEGLSRFIQVRRPRQPGELRPLNFVAEVDPRFLQRLAEAAQDDVLALPDLKKPRVPAGGRRKTIILVADGESNPDQALASEPLSRPCRSPRRRYCWITGIRPCALDGIDPRGRP